MDMQLDALTMHQPWASAVALGVKEWETRFWRPSLKRRPGLLAIHAGKYIDPFAEDPRVVEALGASPLPTGALIAVAWLDSSACFDAWTVASPNRTSPIGERELIFGDFGHGRFAWRLKYVVQLEAPIPMRGYQGLWAVKDAAVVAQLSDYWHSEIRRRTHGPTR